MGPTAGRAQTDGDFLFQKAQIFMASGKYLEALGLYQAVADNGGDDAEKGRAMIMIGYIYAQYLNQPDMAFKYLDFVHKTYPGTSMAGEALFKKGMVLYQLEQYQSAHVTFCEYLEKYPDARWRQSARAWAESAMNLAALACAGPGREEHWPFFEDTIIRVLLAEDEHCLTVSSNDKSLTLSGAFSGKTMIDGVKKAVLAATDGKITVNGAPWNNAEPLKITTSGLGMDLDGKRYRGHFLVSLNNNRLSAVNYLDIEEYLFGVVPCEVPASWPRQALMAQAVAARTYALYIKQNSRDKTYDVRATTSDQVYGGMDAEQLTTRFAVNNTRGQVLTYDGKLIVAYFHANSGGYTERPENVWGARVPYLKDLPDMYSKNAPGSTWEYFLPYTEAVQRLRRFGVNASQIKAVEPMERTRSGRIREIMVVSDNGKQKMASNNFRLAIGSSRLKSTCFKTIMNDSGILFKGSGFGHGVGMSQWGARRMALLGHDYKSILSQYYYGTQVAYIETNRESATGKKDNINVARY